MARSNVAKLRGLLAQQNNDSALICPGVYDCLSAGIAVRAGAQVLYVSGASVVASSLGLPDIGLATLTEMSRVVESIAAVNNTTPLIVDADTGYGGAIMCARTFATYSRLGVAAIHVEDQVLAKRCGHLMGKQVVERDEFAARIKAMANQRQEMDSEMLIIARTDALQSHGIEEAIERMRLALVKGADIAFVEGICTAEEAKMITEQLNNVPCLVNLVANGNTPAWAASDAARLGFRLAIYPCASIVPATIAIEESIKALLSTGTDVTACQDRSPKEMFLTLGLKDYILKDIAAGGSALNGI